MPPSDDDLDLFRQEMSDAQPIEQDKINLLKQPDSDTLLKQPRRQENEHDFIDDFAEPNTLVGQEETLVFRRSGIQERQLNKLRQGQVKMEAELDLHGMTIPVAYQALHDFILECQQLNIRGARIIHGKGWSSKHHKPILKTKTNQWLREIDTILAFCSARTEDGGTGAVYLLLKRLDKPQPLS